MGVRLNGKLIKAIRRADGLRQEDLIALCEASNETTISQRSLGNAERSVPVSADTFTRIAKVLRVDPADQLLAEKNLGFSDVRRRPQNGEPETDGKSRKRDSEGLSRVVLDIQTRKRLRLLVLDSVTPTSDFTLQKFGMCFHEREGKGWPEQTFEGFLSACLYYLQRSIRPVDGSWTGNDHAILNSTFMGQHVGHVWGTGPEDDDAIPKEPAAINKFVEMWAQTEMAPIGPMSESLHRYCPALEPTSFYHGWRELSLWLTANGLTADEEGRERSTSDYMGVVLQMVASYLNAYERNESYGHDSFWLMVQYFLRKEFGKLQVGIAQEEFSKYHDYPMNDLLEKIRFSLEFTDSVKEQTRRFIAAYADEDTGFEAAVMKLQTEFIYTGKPHGELVEIKASRHP